MKDASTVSRYLGYMSPFIFRQYRVLESPGLDPKAVLASVMAARWRSDPGGDGITGLRGAGGFGVGLVSAL